MRWLVSKPSRYLNLTLLDNQERVVDVDPKIPDRDLDLCTPSRSWTACRLLVLRLIVDAFV